MGYNPHFLRKAGKGKPSNDDKYITEGGGGKMNKVILMGQINQRPKCTLYGRNKSNGNRQIYISSR